MVHPLTVLLALLPQDAPAPPAAPTPIELSLDGAVRLALDNNVGLRLDALAEEIQRFTYLGSFGSFDPVVNVTAGYRDSEQPASTSLAGATVVQSDAYSLNAGLTYPFELGGRLELGYDHVNSSTNSSFSIDDTLTTSTASIPWGQPLLRGAGRGFSTAERQQAEQRWVQAQARHLEVRADLVSQVTAAYWDLVAAGEALAVADESLALGRRQGDLNRRRLEVGVGTQVEVLQADTQVASAIEARLQAEVALQAADDALKALVFAKPEDDGWDDWIAWWDRPIAATTDLDDAPSAPLPSWSESLAHALGHRPELLQRRAELLIGELDLVRAESNELPGLDLSLGLSGQGVDGKAADAVQSAVEFDYPTASASLTWSAPLRNRSAENARHAARLGVRSARLAYEQTELSVLAEVRSAVRDLGYRAEAVRAAQTSLELAERQLTTEEARYGQGLSTNFQVLEYQQQLSAAKSGLVAARVALAKARTNLALAEGRLAAPEVAR